MRIGEVMTTRAETVTAGESVENALRRMRARRIRHLVVKLGGHALGVVSIRDLDSLPGGRAVCTVADVMRLRP